MFIDYFSDFDKLQHDEQSVSSLLAALLYIKDQVPALQAGTSEYCRECCGICFHLSEVTLPHELFRVSNRDLFDKIASMWPKYSGDSDYPVPSPNGNIHPVVIYTITKNCWIGEYGALRIELLDWCIEYCKQWVGNSQGEEVKV